LAQLKGFQKLAQNVSCRVIRNFAKARIVDYSLLN